MTGEPKAALGCSLGLPDPVMRIEKSHTQILLDHPSNAVTSPAG